MVEEAEIQVYFVDYFLLTKEKKWHCYEEGSVNIENVFFSECFLFPTWSKSSLIQEYYGRIKTPKNLTATNAFQKHHFKIMFSIVTIILES